MTIKKRMLWLLLTSLLALGSFSVMAGVSCISLLHKDWPEATVKDLEAAIQAGADANERDVSGQTPLSLAIRKSKPELAKFLLQHGADANLAEPASVTPLMMSVSYRNLAIVGLLLNAGADACAVNASGTSVLDMAADHSDLKIVDLLVEKGARRRFIDPKIDPNAIDEKGTPLLIQAVLAKELASIEYLLRKGAKPNTRDAEGSTPLIRALYSFSYAAPLLIKYGADIRLSDSWHRTPLHVAAKNSGNKDLLTILEAGADVEAIASGSYTPLMYAFSGSFENNAALLLEFGAKIRVRDDLGREPIHFACLTHNLGGVLFALEAGADINSRDLQGNTPLMTVFQDPTSDLDQLLEFIDYLLAHGAEINSVSQQGQTILQLAEKCRDPQVLKFLADRGAVLRLPASITAGVKIATSALILQTVQDNRPAMAEFLAETLTASEPLAMTAAGETALHLAITREWDSLARVLLKQGFDPNLARADGATSLHLAIRNYQKHLIPELLRAGARPEIADKNGETALSLADSSGDMILYELLNNWSNATKKTPDSQNASPGTDIGDVSLLKAIKSRRLLSIERLLVDSPRVDEQDNDGNTALHFTISRYSRRWATALLKAGANPAVANKEGKTPLHLAAREGNLILSRLFLDHGAPIDATDLNGRTPLSLAVEAHHLPLAELLLLRGANINKTDKNGQPPLFYAVQNDPYLTTFSWLVKRGATLNMIDKHGRTIFHHVMINSRSKWCISKLLKLGADPLQLDRWGDSPMSLGFRAGSSEITDFLFTQNPDFAGIASRGASILHNWARNNNVELLARAIASGTSPNLADQNGEPLLFAAIAAPTASAAAILLQAGADLNVTNASGVTLLETAIRLNKTETISWLLESGADPNQSGSTGVPPLWLATGKWDIFALLLDHGARPEPMTLNDTGMEQISKVLLETPEGVAALRNLAGRGVDLKPLIFSGNTPDEKAEKAFRWAFLGYLDSMELAIDFGFDLQTTDNQGYTVLHWAARRGNVEMVRRLLAHGAPLEAKSHDSETPLSFALSGNLHDAVEVLLEAGAKTKLAASKVGASLLHEAASSDASPAILDRLIRQGFDINCRDANGGTPLLWAAEGSATSAASHLLALGADPNIQTLVASFSIADEKFIRNRNNLYSWQVGTHCWSMSGITPIARAVVKKNAFLVQKLLQHGARLDITDGLGNTPLHLAFIADTPELVEVMSGYKLPVLVKNLEGNTPIDLADNKGLSDIAMSLWKTIPPSVTRDPAETALTASSSFPLHDAVRRGELTGLRWLVRQKIRVDSLDEEGHTALWVAVDQGRQFVAKTLLQLGASAHFSGRNAETPWLYAIRLGNVKVVEVLASAGVDLNSADKSGETALHIAAQNLNHDLVEFLLGMKALPGVGNSLGRTPLMEAILQQENPEQNKQREMVINKINAKILALEIRKNKSKKRWNPFKKKTSQIDIRSPRTRTIEALAVKDQAILVADIYGQTALHLAAKNSESDVIRMLLQVGADLEARDRSGRTPVYHAIAAGNIEALKELAKHGAILNTIDLKGETPLSLTDAFNRPEIRDFLLKSGVPPETIIPNWPASAIVGVSPLAKAAGENRFEAVRLLLKKGDQPDAAGETALFYAVRSCNPAMVELLIANETDPARVNKTGQTPLDIAVSLAKKNTIKSYIPTDASQQYTDLEISKDWARIIELLEHKQSTEKEGSSGH